MEEVTVKKNDLIQVIETNRERHNIIFEESVKGYWEKATEELNKQVEKARVKDSAGLYLSQPYPTSHEQEYSTALRQLEMSVDDEITLTKGEFNQLVMNNWSWRSSFLSYSTTYTTGSYLAASGIAAF